MNIYEKKYGKKKPDDFLNKRKVDDYFDYPVEQVIKNYHERP